MNIVGTLLDEYRGRLLELLGGGGGIFIIGI